MRTSKALALFALGLAIGISGPRVEAARSAEVEKQKSFEHRVDTARGNPASMGPGPCARRVPPGEPGLADSGFARNQKAASATRD